MTNEKSVEIQISFPEHLRGGVYSNNMIVAHTKEEFFLDFLMVAPPSGTVTARVILSPGHVKRVVGYFPAALSPLRFRDDREGDH